MLKFLFFMIALLGADVIKAQTPGSNTTTTQGRKITCSTLMGFGAMETACILPDTLPTESKSIDTIRCEAIDSFGTYMEIVIWPADVAITLSDKLLLTADMLKQPYTVQIAKTAVTSRAAWLALPPEQRVGFVRWGLNMPVAQVKEGCILAIWAKTGEPK